MAYYTKDDLVEIIERDFIDNEKCFAPGRRNDDAVDLSIICWCLDRSIPDTVLEIEAKQGGWTEAQRRAVQEHLDRVFDYLPSWGDHGTMEAMAYSIDY